MEASVQMTGKNSGRRQEGHALTALVAEPGFYFFCTEAQAKGRQKAKDNITAKQKIQGIL